MPPGVTRAFRNVGTEEGILLVVISGGAHNMHDIHMPEAAAHAIHAASPAFMQRLADSGITYSGELA